MTSLAKSVDPILTQGSRHQKWFANHIPGCTGINKTEGGEGSDRTTVGLLNRPGRMKRGVRKEKKTTASGSKKQNVGL